MSKSQWLKDENQNGNFSNEKKDTFDPSKRYVGIRLQQGVPLLDRDWNELEDIRRYEEMMLRRWYVGNGSPDDGFRICPTDPPTGDFKIMAGRCLVCGLEVVNEPHLFGYLFGMEDENGDMEEALNREEIPDELKNMFPGGLSLSENTTVKKEKDNWVITDTGKNNVYFLKKERENEKDKLNVYPANFILYSQQKLADSAIPDLITPDADRIDTVHLDVWIKEVRSEPEPGGTDKDKVDISLENSKDVNIETCVRHRLVWRVRVDEGSKGDYKKEDTDETKHRYYDLARITRNQNEPRIQDIQDLREAAGKRILDDITTRSITLKNEEVASSRWPKLSCSDAGDVLIILPDGNVGVGTREAGGRLDVAGDITIRGKGGTGLCFADASGIVYKDNWIGMTDWVEGTKKWLHIGGITDAGEGGDKFRRVGIWASKIYMAGNVGIGTMTPASRLEIRGTSTQNAYYVDDGQEDLRVLSSSDRPYDGGIITIGGSRGPTGYIKTIARSDKAGEVVIGNRRSASATRMEPGIVLDTNGNVGIGTTPSGTLHIRSSYDSPSPRANYIYLDDSTNTNLKGYIGINRNTAAGANKEYLSIEAVKEGVLWIPIVIGGDGGNVGIGTTEPGNDKLDVRGFGYFSEGLHGTNSDYAEYFESADGAAILVATPVVLTNEGKVRAAKKGEVPIGIVTKNSAFVGNSYKEWPRKYKRDKYGRLEIEKVREEKKIPKKEKVTRERQKVKREKVTEKVVHPEIVREKGKYIQKEKIEKITREVEVPLFDEVDLYDASGKKIIGKHRVPVMETYEEEVDVLDETGSPVLIGFGEFVTWERPKLNPEYDETKKYIPRSERPEWNCVGLLGQIPLRKGKSVAPTWIKIKDLSDDVELWLVK